METPAAAPEELDMSNPLTCLLCKVYIAQSTSAIIKHTVRVSLEVK